MRNSKSWSFDFERLVISIISPALLVISFTIYIFYAMQTLHIFCNGVLSGIILFRRLSGSRLKYEFIEETAFLIRGLLNWRAQARKQLQFGLLILMAQCGLPGSYQFFQSVELTSVFRFGVWMWFSFHRLTSMLGCHNLKFVFPVTVVNFKCFFHDWEEGLWNAALCSLL